MIRPFALIVIACAALAAVAEAPGARRTWDFQGDAVGGPPAGFTLGRTGGGAPAGWVVEVDASAPAGDHVLSRTGSGDDGFPLAVADAPVLRDVRVEVRCKPVAGEIDRACGVVARLKGLDDYYVARANALEDNVNLYRVVGGRRSELEGWTGKVTSGAWHTLSLEVRGNVLTVTWDGKQVIEARDDTFPEAGRIGVWTKADSVTRFDALTATELR
ncbi:MAG: hypothetical protein U0229_22515 [Anaeromyxobacter sp.]